MFSRFLLVSCLLAWPASAQTAVPVAAASSTAQSQVLTLDDALAMAQRNSPRVRGAVAATARADAATRTARAYANPSVEVFVGRQYARPIATPGVPGLLQHYAAYQAIEIPAERRARLRTAQLATVSSRLGEAGVALSITADVKHAFYTVLRRREEIEHTQESLKLVEDLRRRVEVQVRVGEQGRLELTRAEAELARAGFAVRSAQLELSNAIALLRVAIAAPADARLDPLGALEPRVQLASLPELRAIVLSTHPAIAQTQADLQTAQAKLEHDRRLRIPQPILFAEFENQPDLRFWRAGMTIPLPLWDRRQGQIAESKAAISQGEAVLDQRRLELISATEWAFEQYQLADEQVTSLESAAQMSLIKAVSQQSLAEAATRRAEQLVASDVIGRAELERRQAELLQASTEAASYRTQLRGLGMSDASIRKLVSSRELSADYFIVSPKGGTVLERKITIAKWFSLPILPLPSPIFPRSGLSRTCPNRRLAPAARPGSDGSDPGPSQSEDCQPSLVRRSHRRSRDTHGASAH